MGPFVAFAGLAAFVGGVVWLAWFMDKRRTEQMQAWAQGHGFVFEGERPELITQLGRFKLFNQGRSRKAKNLMRTSRDLGAVSVLDYQYVTGSGKHQTTHLHTVCIIDTPGKTAPHFFVRKQYALFDSLGKLFGGQDINFDDDPAFSKAYVLQTDGGEQQLRHFMTPRLREGLTALADRTLVVEVAGETMVLHFGRRLAIDKLEGLVADAINVRRLWS